jgi:glycosyltransferase involved in cell wall biosynthesis
MRVLQVHNFYRSSAPSGEDEVVRGERELLRAHGVEVVGFERHNDDYGLGLASQVNASFSNVWSTRAQRELATALERHQPDLVHVHNTFPQISPSVYSACMAAKVPVVQTLHNFRLFCANGLLSRNGQPCERCVTAGAVPGILHGCYRNSRLATLGMSLSSLVHRPMRTHTRGVSRFIALTEFARALFIAAGLPAERIGVRGNALAADPPVGSGSGGYALYVGRLSEEKGVSTLIDAWCENPGITLRVAGDGPLEQELRSRSAHRAISFLGRQSREQVAQLMSEATMLVIPSICYEGFPRVFVEALAAGTPVVASRLGGLAEIVREREDGLLVEPGEAGSLHAAISELHRRPDLCAQMRRLARARYEREFSVRCAFESLMREYAAAQRLH